MATIAIDAGHGGNAVGAANGFRQEKSENLAFAIAVGKILECRCHRVLYTRQTDINPSFEERVKVSNNANADLFISIHRNSSSIASANGVENFVSPYASATSRAFAQNVLNRILALNLFANRGIKQDNFYVLNNTNAPAQLLELGFISNAGDNYLIDTNFSKIAAAIADGIEDSVGKVPDCTCGGIVIPPPPPPPKNLVGTVTTAGSNLNLRSGPSTASGIIASMPNGSTVEIISEQNGFYQVIFSGQTGWASSAFIQPKAREATVTTQGGNLNLRSGPSTSSTIIAVMPNGSRVVVTNIFGNFYEVNFGGRVGYASKDYITLN